MAVLDLSEPVSRIRLACGDVTDLPYLPDDVYQYCLDKNVANESAATRMAAQLILAQLSYGTHSRIGPIEQWGQEAFAQYLIYIRQVISNPSLNATGGIFVAGMYKDDVDTNNSDSTLVQHKLPVYPYENYDNEDSRTLPLSMY